MRYRVYANELSVRTSHIDETHAFLVGAALFLGVEGHEGSPSRMVLDVPAEWRAVTSLEPHAGGGFAAPDLENTFLAVVATSSRALNESIYREAQLRGVLCNVVDDPEYCDFYYGNVVEY